MGRMLAILDADNVLVGRNDSPTDEEWAKAPAKLRFETGFDNAVKRYRLVEWKKGSWRFEAIAHGKDVGSENTDPSKAVSIADIVNALIELDENKGLNPDTRKQLQDYLETLDAQG